MKAVLAPSGQRDLTNSARVALRDLATLTREQGHGPMPFAPSSPHEACSDAVRWAAEFMGFLAVRFRWRLDSAKTEPSSRERLGAVKQNDAAASDRFIGTRR
jgi:hypothetical protein